MALEGGPPMKVSAIWQIEGTLETVTPMHVGDGGSRLRRITRDEEEFDAEIQTVAKTHDKRGRIPGAALKGVLRTAFGKDDATARELFGLKERGASVQFLDAYS